MLLMLRNVFDWLGKEICFFYFVCVFSFMFEFVRERIGLRVEDLLKFFVGRLCFVVFIF